MNSRASQFGVLGALAFGTSLHGATIVSSVDTFGSGENAFTIGFVEVGNPGNADDAGAGGGIYSSPYGGVSYTYRIGMFEISEDAITKAIASGLEGVEAGFRTGNKPATFMMWYEAAAFVNWLKYKYGAPGRVSARCG